MASLSSSLSIGLTGLQATQSAISVVGHNIANVNTENYTRQRADLAARHSVTLGTLTYGSGVNVTSIEGIRDKYLELQITQTISRNSGASTRYTGLQTVDAIFQDDETSGLSTLLSNYFSAFQKLAASPEDSSVRTNLVGRAQNLVDGLQTRYSMLEQQRTQANEAVNSSVDEVNTLTSEIADLNARISSNTTANSNSDAIDQRQALVNQLAELVGIQVYTDNNNQLQVTLDSGAAVLVTGGLAATMSVQKGSGTNNDQVLVTT
ncbi:MAG TPA: flagellar hook-associated protein FlgK, partial [Holophaga sp.]|nr:flagellar hook-associated protein FlgK [Holophaga sp.]